MIFPPSLFSQSSYSATVSLTFYPQRDERNGEEPGSSTREAGQGAQTLMITEKNKEMGQDESPSSCTDCCSTAFFCLSMGKCMSSSFGVLPSSAPLRFLLIHPPSLQRTMFPWVWSQVLIIYKCILSPK